MSPLKYGANEQAELKNENYPRYIRITDINDNGSLKEETWRSLNPEKAKEYILKKGDILFARSGATVGKTYLFKENYLACFAGYLIKATCASKLDPLFLLFFTKSGTYENWKNSIFIQSTIQNIGADKYGYLPIPLPPLSEQQRIVDFLEGKTKKIDQYIAEKEKQLQLLEEYKQTLIANAVTKGLNPNVKMKDSGIPWIGMIPEHWEVSKINSLFTERRQKVSDKDYQPLSVSKFGVTPQLDSAVKTDNGDNRKLVLTGDFVVNSRSDRKGACGISPLDGSVSLINIVLKPRHIINGKYFHYLSRSNNYIEEFYRLGRGIVADLWTTRFSEMKNLMIPLPSLEEQKEIALFIEKESAKINSLISNLQSEISYIKEYKQRLIADCVTGLIKV